MSTTTDLLVSKTILKQLGGGRFIAMTGSFNFIGSNNSLSMKLRRNNIGASHLKIVLNPNDSYTMTFIRVRKFELKTVAEFTEIYFDQLQKLFTETTGMYLSL